MSEEKLISYCGLVCSECPAYTATMKDDPALREQTARTWSEEYGVTIRPEDIVCTGCVPSKGRKFSHCGNCAIRSCAVPREIRTCADCPKYPCGELESFFKMVPAAKSVLEGQR
ncbi:MAG: DUF3795 domain-containing protein [Spirochaetia bacterium]